VIADGTQDYSWVLLHMSVERSPDTNSGTTYPGSSN
jgi:hypothetical protein